MAKFNKSQIMKRAHAYARTYQNQFREKTYRELLAWGLAAHWEEAKKTAADQIAEINNQITMLQFKSSRYDIAAERRVLETEIIMLEAA